MGKDIGRIYKHSQSQLSTLSLKGPVSSSSVPQTSSAIKLTTTSIPSVREKIKTIMLCIPKIPSRLMQASQIMMTYVAFQPFQRLIIIHNLFLPHPQVY